MDRKYKAFLIYAYAFIFFYMVNSLITWFFMKAHLSPVFRTVLEAFIMVLGLYYTFYLLMKRYYWINDKKRITVAWLFHFVPFIITSFLLFFLLFKAIPNPAFAIFVYLNGDVLLLFFTYKFAVEKFIERESG